MPYEQIHYELNCTDYVLFRGDKPISKLLQEVSLAFDKEAGVLMKHGSKEMVSAWLSDAQEKLRSGGAHDLAEQLIMVTGRFPVDELNKCISISGYIGKLWMRMQAGEIAALPNVPKS